MALKIRLRQQGCTNRHTYRLVVCDGRIKRDGKYLEKLGWYDPLKEGDKSAFVNPDLTKKWLGVGAIMSEEARSLIARCAPQVMKEWVEKKQAKRAADRIKKKKRKAEKKFSS